MLLLFCSDVLLEINRKEAYAEAIIVDSLKSTFRSVVRREKKTNLMNTVALKITPCNSKSKPITVAGHFLFPPLTTLLTKCNSSLLK